ncbi:MAG: GNAT family N-acetyltransferase [Candidatus Cloacimonetes bacterium]|nr:GNAT family N-acetyltransferase [Candidatus Cloacimonadota bacterium]
MSFINIEVKVRCMKPEIIRNILDQHNADFKGTDHQIDTYFKVPKGRLKLREGNIENSLIYYQRKDGEGPKQSDVILFHPQKNSSLKETLSQALGILKIVRKMREIYFINNIKFHIDEVKNLGSFIEIEAIDRNGKIGQKKLHEQCEQYMKLFKVKEEDLIKCSYSDLLLNKEIEIKEGTIKEAVAISRKIPEFNDPYNEKEYLLRFNNKKHLILVAYYKNNAVGFKAGYETEDGFYTWMGGVLQEYRRMNIARKLARSQEKWLKENDFKKIKLKTLNKHKAMIHFALSEGFKIVGCEPDKNSDLNKIFLEKIL